MNQLPSTLADEQYGRRNRWVNTETGEIVELPAKPQTQLALTEAQLARLSRPLRLVNVHAFVSRIAVITRLLPRLLASAVPAVLAAGSANCVMTWAGSSAW